MTEAVKKKRKKYSLDSVKEEAKKYNTRLAFQRGSTGSYQWAMRRKLLDTVCPHMTPVYRNLTDAELMEIAAKYTYKKAFVRGDSAAFATDRKRNLLEVACAHMTEGNKSWKDPKALAEEALKYQDRSSFERYSPGAYTTARVRKVLDSICTHMTLLPSSFNNDKPCTVYYIRFELSTGEKVFKFGVTTQGIRDRISTMRVKVFVMATVLKVIQFSTGAEAKRLEKQVQDKYAEFRYSGPAILGNGNTELYQHDILGYDVHTTEGLKTYLVDAT